MPIYEYQCHACQSVFEEWQSGFEEKEMECPECGESAKRLISHSSFHLKGGGWYSDGYGGAKSGSVPGEASESTGSESKCPAKADAGGESPAPAAKTESSDTSSAGSAS